MSAHDEGDQPREFKCPECKLPMLAKGEGLYECPNRHGEWLSNRMDGEPPTAQAGLLPGRQVHESQPWPELYDGMPTHLVQGMKDIATIPLGVVEPEVAKGHGGKGGRSKSGGGKSPARQKLEAWQRRSAPGRYVRSIRLR